RIDPPEEPPQEAPKSEPPEPREQEQQDTFERAPTDDREDTPTAPEAPVGRTRTVAPPDDDNGRQIANARMQAQLGEGRRQAPPQQKEKEKEPEGPIDRQIKQYEEEIRWRADAEKRIRAQMDAIRAKDPNDKRLDGLMQQLNGITGSVPVPPPG